MLLGIQALKRHSWKMYLYFKKHHIYSDISKFTTVFTTIYNMKRQSATAASAAVASKLQAEGESLG